MSYYELILGGSFGRKNSAWKRPLSLSRKGLVDILPLVTSLPISRWEEGFKTAQTDEAAKVILEPGR